MQVSHEDAGRQLNGFQPLFKRLSSKIWAAIFDYTCCLAHPSLMEMRAVPVQAL